MLLPHLELLDMSDNEIEDIQAIANIKSRYLTTIILNDNKIQTLSPFYEEKPKYFKLQTLAVQNNEDLIGKEKEFKGIKEMHKGIKILFESININEFNKRHNTNIIEDEKSYNLGRIKKNREILLDDLFSLIKFENKIRYLILDNNNIKDASLLSKMPLFSLRRLDLSVNKINNISFLKKLSKTCKKLADLFLDNNNIYDISVLKCAEPEDGKEKKDLEIGVSTGSEQKNKNKNEENYKPSCIFHYLKNLSIKINKFDANKDAEIKGIIECFNNEDIITDIEFDKKDDKKKLNDESNQNEPNENNNNN
jgi:Leucine-rich repeat (LRR) protein